MAKRKKTGKGGKRTGPIGSAVRFSQGLMSGAVEAGDQALGRVVGFNPWFGFGKKIEYGNFVKAPFRSVDGEIEHMWVRVSKVTPTAIEGVLDNEPVFKHSPALKMGSVVKVKKSAAEKVMNPAKFDRCVKEVKAKGRPGNAYAICTAAGTRNPKKKKEKFYEPGTRMRFDGNDPEAGAWGFFDVEVVDWEAVKDGYDSNGRRVLPKATVRNLRTGRVFTTYTHNLKPLGAVTNPAKKMYAIEYSYENTQGTKKWRLLPEGPWESKEDAQDFGDAEVGYAFRVVSTTAKEFEKKLVDQGTRRSNPIHKMASFDSKAAADAFVRVMEADRGIAIKYVEKKGGKWWVEYAELGKASNPVEPIALANELVGRLKSGGYITDDGGRLLEMVIRRSGLSWSESIGLVKAAKKTDGKADAKAISDAYQKKYGSEKAQEQLRHRHDVRLEHLHDSSYVKPEKIDSMIAAQLGKRKSNPSDAAAGMYESFHGKPSDQIEEFEEKDHYHSNLAGLGWMIGLKVRTPSWYDVTIEFDDVLLCSNEDGTQLFLVGGDQSLDLDKLKIDNETGKESVVIGEAWLIGYHTEKDFDEFKPIDYIHGFGHEKDHAKLPKNADLWNDAEPPKEESFGVGNYPTLRYDGRNQKLYLDGGIYKIEKPMFETSPGIEG